MKYILLSLLSISVITGSCSKMAKTVTTITTTKVRSLDSICPTSLIGNFNADLSGRPRSITDTVGGIMIHYHDIPGLVGDNLFATVNCDSQTIHMPVQAVNKPSFFDSVRATGHIYPGMLVISYAYWERIEYKKWLDMGDDTLRPR